MPEQNWNDQLKEWILKRLIGQELGSGAKVKIRRDSKYAHQSSSFGIMQHNFGDHSRDSGGAWAMVKFNDGSSNRYRMQDLELSDPIPEGQIKARKLNGKDIVSAAQILGLPERDVKKYIDGKVQDLKVIPRDERKIMYQVTGIGILRPEFEIPNFEGKELKNDGKKHKINFLRGDFGKEVLDEFNERVKAEYKGSGSLKVLSSYDDVIRGSNPFAVVLVNQIIRSGGFRTATPADLERVLEQGEFNFGSCCNDTALVLRSQCGYNVRLAQHLAKQVKDMKGKFEYPIMVPLVGLDLDDPSSEVSINSGYGLAFRLREDAEIIHSPQLAKENHGQTFNRGDEKGLPILGSSGNRTLYTTQFGLVRAYLDGNRNFYADNDHLRSSNENGWVVVVSAEGAALENLGGNQ